MAVEFTKDIYQEVMGHIEAHDFDRAARVLGNLHPYDIAQVVKELDDMAVPLLFDCFDEETSGEILSEMDREDSMKIVRAMKPDLAYKKFLAEMDSDDAADIINELPKGARGEFTEFLKKTVGEEAKNIVQLLKYDEDTAGGLMAKELVRVNIRWQVSACIEEIRRQANHVETVYAVYVVDDGGKLKGLVPLSTLIVSDPDDELAHFYDEEVVSVEDTAPAEDVADIMRKYDLVALPVIDYLGRLIGRITVDDVMDYQKEEAEEDYQLASGLSENVEYGDKVWVLSRARLPWLFLGLLGGIASSKVIGLYEYDLQIYPEMAFFIPLIAAMGGNAGVQSSAIVVQSIAAKSITEKGLGAKLLKEFLVSLVNALLCSAALLGYGLLMSESINLSFTVSGALLTVIIIASVLGAFIPLFLNKFNIDPALATGPFITTTNDLLGLGIYFFIGRLMYSIDFSTLL